MVTEAILISAGAILAIVVLILAARGDRRRNAAEQAIANRPDQVSALYAAAAESDEEARRLLETTDVNRQNADGDSALHLAYHARDADAVARLVELGADETLINHEGFTPAEMSELADTEDLIERTAACMAGDRWRDPAKARPLYESLTRCSPRLYNPALVRVALRRPHNRSIVCLAVKVGLPGSEDRLAAVLDAHGTQQIATDYLNAGSPALADAARRWAAAHGYVIHQSGYGATVRWGSF